MLGYVRAYKPELKFKEYDLYRGVYCSLCKTLLHRYSPLGQIFLSYDVTFFAVVLFALSEDCPAFRKSRCCWNPAKRCHHCGRHDVLDFCADVSVLLSYYKLLDDLRDRGSLKKILAALLFPAVSCMHRKAVRKQPQAERIVRDAMRRQADCEKDGVGLDAAADPSAQALAELAALRTPDQNVRQLFYLLGRFVYCIDAVDDVRSDIRKKNFNPLREKYQNDPSAFRDYALALLNGSIGEMLKLFDRIRFRRMGDIIYNVLFYGQYNSALYVTEKYKTPEVTA